MMTKMTGTLVRVLLDEVRVAVGPFEYAVMVSEAVRRQLQLRSGQEVTLHLMEYYEGNQAGTRLTPRKIGFQTELELEFFELFCTVDKIGVKKALKAMSRSVRDIADAISRQDAKWLSTLPGIGAATAEGIVNTLKRKVAPFVVGPQGEEIPPPDAVAKAPAKRKPVAAAEPAGEPAAVPTGQLIEDVYQALMGLGLTPVEARERLDKLLQSGQPFGSVDDAIRLIFARGKDARPESDSEDS